MSTSLTHEVFGYPQKGYYRVYYNILKRQDFERSIQNPQKHPVVLMFFADWNEPSKVMLKPYRDMALAKKMEAIFCRVDVDKFNDFVAKYTVEALPTFVLIKDGSESARVVGAKVQELNTTIKNNI